MKKFIALTLMLTLFTIQCTYVKAVITDNNLDWGTGTIVNLMGEISSEQLTDDLHTLSITLTLLSLNDTAVELYNIRVDYRIPDHFSQYRPLSRLSIINSTSKVDVLFQYDSLWGNCNLEMSLSFDENNTLTDDPTYVTGWIVYFNLEPYVQSTTPTTPPTSTPPSSTPTGFDWAENWYIFLIIGGGILLVLVLVRLGIFVKNKK